MSHCGEGVPSGSHQTHSAPPPSRIVSLKLTQSPSQRVDSSTPSLLDQTFPCNHTYPQYSVSDFLSVWFESLVQFFLGGGVQNTFWEVTNTTERENLIRPKIHLNLLTPILGVLMWLAWHCWQIFYIFETIQSLLGPYENIFENFREQIGTLEILFLAISSAKSCQILFFWKGIHSHLWKGYFFIYEAFSQVSPPWRYSKCICQKLKSEFFPWIELL